MLLILSLLSCYQEEASTTILPSTLLLHDFSKITFPETNPISTDTIVIVPDLHSMKLLEKSEESSIYLISATVKSSDRKTTEVELKSGSKMLVPTGLLVPAQRNHSNYSLILQNDTLKYSPDYKQEDSLQDKKGVDRNISVDITENERGSSMICNKNQPHLLLIISYLLYL